MDLIIDWQWEWKCMEGAGLLPAPCDDGRRQPREIQAELEESAALSCSGMQWETWGSVWIC